MTTSTTNRYFVLFEGETEEKELDGAAIREKCASGELTPASQIFVPSENKWCALSASEFASEFVDTPSPVAVKPVSDENEALELDYRATLDRLKSNPRAIEIQLEAGHLACELGHRREARKHFQDVLTENPFHARAAREVYRHFSRKECREFKYLDRPAPAWDDIGELLRFPFAAGPIYALVPAVVLAALLFVPYGAVAVAALAIMWGYYITSGVGVGETEPPSIAGVRSDPLANVILPGLALSAVAAQLYGCFYLLGRLAMLVERESAAGTWEYLSGSPIFLVGMTLAAVAYLPASILSISYDGHSRWKSVNPVAVLRSAVRMGGEYLGAVLMILVFAFMVGAMDLIVGGVPVLGKILVAIAIAVVIPMAGFVLGCLQARQSHLID